MTKAYLFVTKRLNNVGALLGLEDHTTKVLVHRVVLRVLLST